MRVNDRGDYGVICEHDWVIHPDTVDEDKHELCPHCRYWIPKQAVQGATDADA